MPLLTCIPVEVRLTGKPPRPVRIADLSEAGALVPVTSPR